MLSRLIALACLCANAGFANADAISELKTFISSSRTLSAHFEQQVQSQNGKKTQKASGDFFLQRPGKFRWEYTTPIVQTIVGDGSTIWIYDPELQQVIQKKQNAALGNTPAALLAGNNDLESRYQIKNLPDRNNAAWLEATPKDRDNSFKTIRMGFIGGAPTAMELTDNFGQVTHIFFSGTKTNPALEPKLFRFSPPKGVDIIKDEQ